jgi:hypothetical protein
VAGFRRKEKKLANLNCDKLLIEKRKELRKIINLNKNLLKLNAESS